MVSVGLFAAVSGGSARWAYPVSLLGATTLGGFVGYIRPLAEPIVLALVLIVSLALLSLVHARRLSGIGSVIALWGAAHGYAHGLELPAFGGPPFGVGLLLAIGVLQGIGLLLGFAPRATAPRGHRHRRGLDLPFRLVRRNWLKLVAVPVLPWGISLADGAVPTQYCHPVVMRLVAGLRRLRTLPVARKPRPRPRTRPGRRAIQHDAAPADGGCSKRWKSAARRPYDRLRRKRNQWGEDHDAGDCRHWRF